VTVGWGSCLDQSACNYDPADFDDGSCEYIEEGECNCNHDVVDECGICDGDNSSCADCCGIPNGAGDSCDGECGACNAVILDGNCDCDGNVNDECGVCGGDNSSCTDCCGVPNGDDSTCDGECGACNAVIPDGNCDCDGNVLDECGVCGGDNSSCVYTVVQSQEQAIYSFSSVTLDGEGLGDGDWLIARNNDIIVGVAEWTGSGTEVVIMGEELSYFDDMTCDSGPVNTCGMMMSGQTPQFYVFDSSAPLESIAQYTAADGTILQTIPTYNGLDYNIGVELHLVTDCYDDIGGAAVTSGLCGDCWGGNTDLAENYMDTDDDDVCNDGAANGDDDNCPNTVNTDQLDNDGDEEGDECDDDDDNDTCLDTVDDAPFEWDDNYDGDDNADDCDGDDDNDGAADADDTDDNNEYMFR
jgi:hypothetical protein